MTPNVIHAQYSCTAFGNDQPGMCFLKTFTCVNQLLVKPPMTATHCCPPVKCMSISWRVRVSTSLQRLLYRGRGGSGHCYSDNRSLSSPVCWQLSSVLAALNSFGVLLFSPLHSHLACLSLTRSNSPGRACVPMCSRSGKPRVTSKAVLSPCLSSKALVATVVPILIHPIREVSTGWSLEKVCPVSCYAGMCWSAGGGGEVRGGFIHQHFIHFK